MNLLSILLEDDKILSDDDLEYFIKSFKMNLPPLLYEYASTHRELYILYHIAINLKRDDSFLANIYNIIIKFLPSANGFFYRTVSELSKEYKNLIYKYSVFNDKVLIRSDILNIFFLGMFLNTDPIHILNYCEYYRSVFRLIFFEYLKNKTDGLELAEEELITSTILTDDYMHVSNRCKIFEDGIKISQIYDLCHESDTLRRINDNFNYMRNKILPNDFQKLYSIIIDKTLIRDNKFLILKFNLNSDFKLDYIRYELPIIYKLLRSIKIKSKNKKNFNIIERGVIKQNIKDIVYEHICLLVEIEYAEILSESISRNLENSITYGEFLDPFTLTTLNIDTNMFIIQLKSFLKIILKNIKIEELNHV